MKTRMWARNFISTIAVLFGCVALAQAQITVTEARIGCLDNPTRNEGNLTQVVAKACNGQFSCSFKAPTPQQYTAEGVRPYTRSFCTQAMEIKYTCAGGGGTTVLVPGDAWDHPAAQLFCEPHTPPPGNTTGSQNPQVAVLQSLLQKYKKCIVEQYESPTPPNPALGPLRDSATCVDGNTCTIASRLATYQKLQVQANRGDPTNFETMLHSAILNDCFQCGTHAEWHTKQMHCTWNSGGNQSWYADPLHFNAGIGPAFETCKAGVDISKLVNDVVNDIHGVLQGVGLAGNQEPANATGGLTVATNHTIVNPPREACELTPSGYFIAPPELLDWTPTNAPQFKEALTNYEPPTPPTRAQYNPAALASTDPNVKPNIGANEGRLRPDLRDAAARRNPVASLCQAAAAFALGNASDGNAFADLSVTGRHAFAAFRAQPPQDAQILACLQNNPRTKALPAATLQHAADAALDRAYRVANVLRAGGWSSRGVCPERNSLGYIAVSGEDDQPHRPVNVPSAEFPQYDLEVLVPRPNAAPLSVHTRYMIAHTFPPAGAQLSSCASNARTLPADRAPVLAQDAIVFLYIDGMDSRLEEALDITHALHALGRQRNKNYTVISMDLPTSGYADNIDYNLIAPLTAAGHAGGGIDGLGFAPNKYVVPIVDFDENFIVNFINTLDHSTGVTHHAIYPIGGSLGGNMSFRLGRPRPDAPWINTVIPWSPAAIWPSLADDPVKHAGLATPWYFAGGDPNFAQETPGSRRSFFYGGFDWQSKAAWVIPLGGGQPQSEYWYSNNWECKHTHVKFARIERYETYDHYFRLWHWRLGMEQLLFSQQISRPGVNPPQPLYLSNTKRMLLLCGMDDTGGGLCQDARDVAPKMEMTPGRALFLQATGHSIHNEHPMFLAEQIVNFVDPGGAAASGPPPGRSLTAKIVQTGVDANGPTVKVGLASIKLHNWMVVSASDNQTGKPVEGRVTISGLVQGQTATGGGATGQKVYFECQGRGVLGERVELGRAGVSPREIESCRGTVSAAGYTNGFFAVAATNSP